MLLALAVLGVLYGQPGQAQELVGPHRSVLQTADSIDDELGPSTLASVFQQVYALSGQIAGLQDLSDLRVSQALANEVCL